MHSNQLLSPRTIEGLIAAGHIVVIKDGSVLQLDDWMYKHPGGRLPLLHMVGRDATDEINAYHSNQALSCMNKYRIGRIERAWVNFTPPIRGGTFRGISDDINIDTEVDTDTSLTDIDDDNDTDWSSYTPSWSSSRTSLDLDEDVNNTKSSHISPPTAGSPKQSSSYLSPPKESYSPRHRKPFVPEHHDEAPTATSPLSHLTSPEIYTTTILQQEIDEGIRENPSLNPKTQRDIAVKYQALHERVKQEGFYDCQYTEYGKEVIRYTLLFSLFIVCLRAEWYMTSATVLGLFWQQIMFTAHDAGHRAITHNFVIDTLIGIFIADFCCGLSIGWWKSSHNVHHLVTNAPEHDPDIQNVPLFSTTPAYFRSIKSSYYDGFVFPWDSVADFTVRFQKYTYYPVMCLARFNLYFLSWAHLLNARSMNLGAASWTRPTEIAGMLCYWFLFGYCLLWRSIPTWSLRVAFILVSHIATMPLHVQITLSHWAMPTSDLGEGESFAQRQLRTTMDVECPPWLDFIHGGLQFQAIHHLFPRVPRHNYRKVQVLVKQFCQESGIEYKIYGFTKGNKKVLSRLEEVSAQVDMMIKCQKYMAETGESGLH